MGKLRTMLTWPGYALLWLVSKLVRKPKEYEDGTGRTNDEKGDSR